MSVIIRGDGLVTVWRGDPTYGNPCEGVFYMEPPYTYEQFERHSKDRAKRWSDAMVAKGQRQTSKFDVKGPFQFLDVGRRDLSPEHEGDDEWVLVAWFKGGPEVLPMGEVEDRRLMAQRYGMAPPEPLRRGEIAAKVSPTLADEMTEYRDPNGLTEAGLAEGIDDVN